MEWRRLIESPKPLLARIAVKSDVKRVGAAQNSQYYRKLGKKQRRRSLHKGSGKPQLGGKMKKSAAAKSDAAEAVEAKVEGSGAAGGRRKVNLDHRMLNKVPGLLSRKAREKLAAAAEAGAAPASTPADA